MKDLVVGSEERRMKGADQAIPVPRQSGSVELLAGQLCLDFANTVEPRVEVDDSRSPREYLTDYTDLIAWSMHAGTLTQHEGARLAGRAALRPAAATAALDQALNLREAIYRVFYARALQHVPSAGDL